MKKTVLLILAAAALLTLAACGAQGGQSTATAQISNPFVDYDSLDAAAKDAGFTLTVPDSVEGYTEKLVQVMSKKMIQVIFKNGDDRLFLRKQAGSEDISGDYNQYPETETTQVGSFEVTLRGSDGAVSTATWVRDGYAYALMADVPMSRQAVLDLIGQVK